MRSSVFVAALCAIGAVAVPVQQQKRNLVTETVLVTSTVTVCPTAQAVVSTSEAQCSTTTPITTSTSTPTPTGTPTPSPPPVKAVQSNKKHAVHGTQAQSQPQPTTSNPQPAPQPSSSSSGAATSYQQMVLDAHNVHRANHSVSDLTWDDDLAASAQNLVDKCVYQHDTSIGPASSYGQNIGYGIDAEEIDKMIHWMYDEIVKYEPYFGQPDVPSSVFKDVGHFTQIVWKGTSKVGCATKVCQPLGNAASGQALSFTVCNYGPPGNVAGQYAENVLRPLGHPRVS